MKGYGIYMKPRIFISSTFYDLKYVREDISNFIKSHGFETVMFEDGDIGYTPGQPLDKSCYEAMKNSDMAILIIGGNYGGETSEKTEPSDFSEFISITRQEFKTAYNEGIPIFVFIEASVYSEYKVFDLNKKSIINGNFKFNATKSINVFSFIQEIVNIGNISITEFRKPSEIKDFLEKQWSDMFKIYLKSLREQEDYKKTHNSITELRSAISEMQIFINALVEKTFNTQTEVKYDWIKHEQRNIKSKELARKITNDIDFIVKRDSYETKYDLYQLINAFIQTLIDLSVERKNITNQDNEMHSIHFLVDKMIEKMEELGMEVFMFDSSILCDSVSEMNSDDQLKSKVIEILVNQLYTEKTE